MTDDVFGTAALRRAVLEAWRSSPTRLREDANTEEDHAHGSYRGRVVVELAQNAADAAARAGVPGRLLLSLHAPSGTRDRWLLRAANTGAPLDARGVASLAAMRASATGDDGASGAHAPVGRFGVGFAAVRSVADEIRVGTGDHAVELSLARTRAALDDALVDLPGIAAEVARRGDRLPVLRLPFPAHVDVPAGYDTVVELELRDTAALDALRAQVDEVGDALLLALPALAEVVVSDDGAAVHEERRVADVASRWTVVRREGVLDPSLLADRPVEERSTTRWSVTWALPRDPAVNVRVLHAPTPTDERLTFPALLLATFPLDPSRRHVPPGPLTEHVARAAGDAYAELLAAVAPARGGSVLELVPTGLPASAVDASVRAAAEDAVRRTPLLRLDAPLPDEPPDLLTDAPDAPDGALRGSRLVAPAEARVLAGDVADRSVRSALGVANLVDVPGRLHAVARSLGAEVLDLADVVDDLPLVDDPGRWRALYDALAPHAGERSVLEALGAVPVPLADGRVVRGARGLLVLDGATLDPRDAAALGLRVVAPLAAHPLLERLGARATDLRAVLGDDAVRERVLAAADSAEDGDDPAGDVDRLLGLVAVAVREAGDRQHLDLPFWWGELPVPTTDGPRAPARGCVLAGSWAADVLDGLDVVAPEVVARWGETTLRAVGVAVGQTTLRVRDVLTPASADDEPELDPHAPEGWLSDWAGYLAHLASVLGPEAYVGDVLAVADLDAVADDAWPDALARFAADPDARAALLTPVRVEAGGGARSAPSYTAWWLRGELGGPFAVGDVPFVRPRPDDVAGLDDEVLAALGGLRALDALDPDDWADLLDALPAVGEPVAARDAVALWRALAVLAERGERLDPPPDRLPTLRGAAVVVADAAHVVVGPDPMWAQLEPVLPTPAGLLVEMADLLDLPVVPPGAPAPDDPGTLRTVEPAVDLVAPGAPREWAEHDVLRVGGEAVEWWVSGVGDEQRVHATGAGGLARGLAKAAGRYHDRHAVAQVLVDAGRADAVVAERAFDLCSSATGSGAAGLSPPGPFADRGRTSR